MGIQVMWDNEEHSVLRYINEGHWTWEEFYESRAQARHMIDQTDHPIIDAILDFREGSMLPSGALTQFRSTEKTSHPRLGIMIMVGSNMFVKALFQVMRKLSPSIEGKIRFADSLGEARAILEAPRTDQVDTAT